MKISELIAVLQQVMEEQSDLVVMVRSQSVISNMKGDVTRESKTSIASHVSVGVVTGLEGPWQNSPVLFIEQVKDSF